MNFQIYCYTESPHNFKKQRLANFGPPRALLLRHCMIGMYVFCGAGERPGSGWNVVCGWTAICYSAVCTTPGDK